MSDIMTKQHPITPPPGLVDEWITSLDYPESWGPQQLWIVTQAARWGADQELEACVQVMNYRGQPESAKALFRARRPKPPSLKERALSEIADAVAEGNITPERGATIRLALEALPE